MTRGHLLLLPVLLGNLGCGDAGHAPTPAGSSGSEAVAGAAGQTSGGPSGGADSAAGESAGGDAATGIEVVEVADEPCSASSAEPHIVMAPEALRLSFDRAGLVGERRFAFDSASLALLTFDSNGENGSPILYADLGAAVGFDEQLVTLELAEQGELVVKSYDAMAVALPDSLELDAAGTGSHALAASPDAVLGVWRTGSELRGQLFTPQRLIGLAFDFGPLSCGEHDCTSFVLWTGEHFLVLWSRIDTHGSVVSWAAIDGEGNLLSASNILGAKQDQRLAGAAQLEGGRVAVLLTEGSPALAPLLVFLDAFGTPEPTMRRFLGATQAWGIASHGDQLAIVARSSEGQAVLRPLSGSGEALSTWVCLDDSGKSTGFEPQAALFPDGDGYAAVVRGTDGSAAYLALDTAGQAPE